MQYYSRQCDNDNQNIVAMPCDVLEIYVRLTFHRGWGKERPKKKHPRYSIGCTTHYESGKEWWGVECPHGIDEQMIGSIDCVGSGVGFSRKAKRGKERGLNCRRIPRGRGHRQIHRSDIVVKGRHFDELSKTEECISHGKGGVEL